MAYWVIPPDEDEAFVAAMEQVLEIYERSEAAAFPVVAMDERPVWLVKDLRPPILGTPGRPTRIDYEYERIGVVSAFLFTNSLQAWQKHRNQHAGRVDWRFTTQDARIKLKRLYPKTQS